MKKIAGAIIAVAMSVLCFTLSACNERYISWYYATGLGATQTSDTASVWFTSFSGYDDSHEGDYVIKFNGNGEPVYITYQAQLGEGRIKVYYDYNGEMLDLFQIQGDGYYGGYLEGSSEVFTANETIYIIIESPRYFTCFEGSFWFGLEYYY